MMPRMAAPRGRRQAGGGPRAVQSSGRSSYYTGVRLSPDEYAKVHQAAEALDMSLSGFLGELVRRVEVDADGLPLWADPVDVPAQLPLIERRTA